MSNREDKRDLKLARPPIIEWWIRSSFFSSGDAKSWDWLRCNAFLDQYEEELPELTSLPSLNPQGGEPFIDSESKSYAAEIFAEHEYLVRSSSDGDKTLQLGENELVVTHLRSASDSYPRFDELCDQFYRFLNDYKEEFRPSAIDSLELHNADLVVIPNMAKKPFKLTDFLVSAPILPSEPFGESFDTEWSISFKCPDPRDVAHVAFEMRPPDGSDVRFRLDWHYWCKRIETDDQDSVAERLNTAHDYLNKCFQAIFTSLVWDLFDPY